MENKNILICAHPDDEILFCGQELIQFPKDYIVICTASINRFNEETKNLNHFKFIMNKLGIEYKILDYKDDGFKMEVFKNPQIRFINSKNNNTIENEIKNLLLSSMFNKIITHNSNGEYGHPQHIALSQIVFNTCKELNLLDKLYFFDLTNKGKELRKNKKVVHNLTDGNNYLEILYNNTSINKEIDKTLINKKKEICNYYQYAKDLLNGPLLEFRDYSIISKCDMEVWKTDYKIYSM